ncbi:hypothetical protein CSPX01_08638 [Colletotrichum filicis]|nr:hypothetical protein CSPX01_08638 [Colletotrichum filicis]
MDSLPQEILDNILGRIPARESDNYNEKLLELENWMDVDSEAFDPKTPHAFKRCCNRQTSLRELHVNIVTPEYRHSSGPSDIVENMAHCDIAHTEILRELMLILSEWPDDTRHVTGTSLKFSFFYQLSSLRRNVEGDFLLMQKFPNLESFDLDASEFPFFMEPRREMRKSLINTLSSYQSPTLARHGKLIILPNKYGPFQQLPQMSKDGESDPLFVGLRRAIDGFSEFEYGSHLSSSFFWSPPPSLGDAVPYWQNMTKLKVDCDHDAEEPVWEDDVSELVKRRNIERSYLEDNPPDRQYSVSGDDNVAAWTVNEKVMVPMLTSIAKAAGQMISLKELWFKVILAKYDTYQGSEWFHRFHVDYLAPGVMPDVDDERFPRCKCYSKDWIPEFRARQAGDLEKARLLLRIKTENQKREGTKNSCPDSPRWPLNMDQWQPNEELLDLLRQAGRKAHSKDAVIVRHVHHHRQDYIME